MKREKRWTDRQIERPRNRCTNGEIDRQMAEQMVRKRERMGRLTDRKTNR